MPRRTHRRSLARAWATVAMLAGTAGWLAWRRTMAVDPQHLPPARHEERDIGFRPLAAGAGLVLLGLAAMAGLVLWIYPAAPTDTALPAPLPAFPQPALQDNVAADYATLHARQLQQLNGAYWLDRPRQIVHLPIAQAMDAVAREGIPDWPTAAERRR